MPKDSSNSLVRKRTLTLAILDRCGLQCRHCSVGYGNYKGTERSLTAVNIQEIIAAVDTTRYGTVAFSGGEPSLAPELVRVGIQACQARGLYPAMTTAPVWARTPESAKHLLAELPGLFLLIMSFDFFHMERLSLDHYVNAVEAARTSGVRVLFLISHVNDEEKNELVAMANKLSPNPMIDFHKVVPLGNAKELLEEGHGSIELHSEQDLALLSRSCLLGDPVVDQSGDLYVCGWTAGMADSPFRIPCEKQLDYYLALQSFEDHEEVCRFRQVGLIDGLSPEQKCKVMNRYRGERFVNECDLCLRMIKEDNGRFWREELAIPSCGL